MIKYCKTNPNCPYFEKCECLIEMTTFDDYIKNERVYMSGCEDSCKWIYGKTGEGMEIKDSGNRREFETGAVRDIASGKGRTDLLPLDVVGLVLGDVILTDINNYVRKGDKMSLVDAIREFSAVYFGDMYTAMLEVSKHYEQGCEKYGPRNWEKGIPSHCYIDSAVRHYMKFMRGDKDEPHDRAFLWNLLGAIWTHDNKPELIDLPFAAEKATLCG